MSTFFLMQRKTRERSKKTKRTPKRIESDDLLLSVQTVSSTTFQRLIILPEF